MRAFTKVSYFNRTKTPEVRKSSTKIPQLKQGMDQLDKYYKKQLAKGFRNLIINMIQGYESDVQKIKKSNAFRRTRIIQKVFQSWKEQSQKPQPYQHLKPASPPKMMNITISEFKGQLSAKSTSRSVSKRQPTSPLKAIKKELEIKFFTPNRTTSKKVTRTTSRLRTQNFEIGSEESPVVSNLLGKYYKKKVFKVLLNFLLFQRHQKFKAQHFRNFYISRLSFNILKNHRRARQIKIGGIQNNLTRVRQRQRKGFIKDQPFAMVFQDSKENQFQKSHYNFDEFLTKNLYDKNIFYDQRIFRQEMEIPTRIKIICTISQLIVQNIRKQKADTNTCKLDKEINKKMKKDFIYIYQFTIRIISYAIIQFHHRHLLLLLNQQHHDWVSNNLPQFVHPQFHAQLFGLFIANILYFVRLSNFITYPSNINQISFYLNQQINHEDYS